jgi:hypothetical protein
MRAQPLHHARMHCTCALCTVRGCCQLYALIDNMQNHAGGQLDCDVITASHLDSIRYFVYLHMQVSSIQGFARWHHIMLTTLWQALQYVSLVFAEPSHNTLASPTTFIIIRQVCVARTSGCPAAVNRCAHRARRRRQPPAGTLAGCRRAFVSCTRRAASR